MSDDAAWWVGLNREDFAREQAKRQPSMDRELPAGPGKGRNKAVYATTGDASRARHQKKREFAKTPERKTA